MSGRDGFGRADVDTNLMHDPKAIALARRLRDPALTMSTLGLYVSAVLASWSAGRRVSVSDAAPAWWLVELDEPIAALREVGLVDEEGCVLEHAFAAWFGPAQVRRSIASEAGVRGNIKRWHPETGAIGAVSQPDSRPHRDPIASQSPDTHPTGRPATQPVGPVAGGSLMAAVDDPVVREYLERASPKERGIICGAIDAGVPVPKQDRDKLSADVGHRIDELIAQRARSIIADATTSTRVDRQSGLHH